jgi:hypothetical protein
MNGTTQLFRPRLRLLGVALALSTMFGAGITPANAASRALRPPEAIFAAAISPTTAGLVIQRVTTFQDYQLIAGPGAPGSILPNGPANSIGNVVLTLRNLVPDSNYTVQARNKNSTGVSAWVAFSFRTPPDYPTPGAPQNLRVLGVTATTVTVQWDFDSVFNPTYTYSVNGGPAIQTSLGCSPYCSVTDVTTVTFARSAPGTTTRFSVTATSSLGKVSAPSLLDITN